MADRLQDAAGISVKGPLRVVVVGASGSGKTTFAEAFSSALAIPHIELDVLHWGPSWTPRSAGDFQSDVGAAVAGPAWVIDGNYASVREIVWQRATTLVWLNYSFPRVYARALSRTFRRVLRREELYGGNYESIRQVFDPEWIPWWVPRTFWKYRREYSALLREPGSAHLQAMEFSKPSQAETFLNRCGDDRLD